MLFSTIVNHLYSTPLIPAAISFAAGIFLTGVCRGILSINTVILTATIIGAVIFVLHLQSRGKAAFALFPIFFFVLGTLHGEPARPPENPRHIHNLIIKDEEASLYGIVLQSPDSNYEKSTLLVEAREFIRQDGSIETASGIVQLALRGEAPGTLAPGDTVLARASFSRVKGYSNPGCFDYGRFLANKSIWITGWIASSAHIIKVRDPYFPSSWRKLLLAPEKMRHRIRLFIDGSSLEQQYKALYKAILIGDRSAMAPEIMENFKASGTIHLLAISGLHMGLLTAFVYAIFLWLAKRSTRLILRFRAQQVAAILTIAPIFLYSFIAGFQAPVIRALLMTLTVFFSIILDRARFLPNGIALAGFILLVAKPAYLFDPSFQLSFAAVISITMILPWIEGLLVAGKNREKSGLPTDTAWKVGRWIVGCILISVAATAGTLPFSVLHFNRFSLMSPLATLLTEPFLCLWSLVLGFCASIIQFFSPQLGLLFLGIGAPGLHAATAMTEFFASLPLSSLWMPTPNGWEITAYYILLLSLPHLGRQGIPRWSALCALFFLLLEPFLLTTFDQSKGGPSITFLDVGQGSATAITMGNGDIVLVDGGGPSGQRFNVGEGIIAPYLWSRRIVRIHSMIVTHPHEDHYNGLFHILERFKTKSIHISPSAEENPQFSRLLDLARNVGADIHVPQNGEFLYDNQGERIICLSNGGSFSSSDGSRKNRKENDQLGLVLRLEGKGFSCIFPGDIDASTEKALVEAELLHQADILLAPHHGSGTSNSIIFLERISPRHIVVSAGSSSSRKFPSEKTVARFREKNIPFHNTAVHGALTFKAWEGEIHVQKQRPFEPSVY